MRLITWTLCIRAASENVLLLQFSGLRSHIGQGLLSTKCKFKFTEFHCLTSFPQTKPWFPIKNVFYSALQWRHKNFLEIHYSCSLQRSQHNLLKIVPCYCIVSVHLYINLELNMLLGTEGCFHVILPVIRSDYFIRFVRLCTDKA
jgi:hypothetical protein